MFTIGQTVCLWQTNYESDQDCIRVLREVLVRITEIKTGARGEFSNNPVHLQSLRGIGDDEETYEKHWDVWPESQTNDFMSQWSFREDSKVDLEFPFWSPVEAVSVYSGMRRLSRNLNKNVRILDTNGNPMQPKGDVVRCERHDEYDHPGQPCIVCRLEHMRKQPTLVAHAAKSS